MAAAIYPEAYGVSSPNPLADPLWKPACRSALSPAGWGAGVLVPLAD